MSPKLLLDYFQLKIYNLLYNIIELMERNGFWYCFCNETSGSESKTEQKKWCLLYMLQLDKKIDVDELEKMRKCPLELVLFAEYVFEDLKKIAEFDKSIIESWNADISYKGRNYDEETKWKIYLIDVIEFRFNRNDYCNFV